MVGLNKKHSQDTKESQQASEQLSGSNTPELVKRRANRNSTIRSGRTIGEARERLETKNERVAARRAVVGGYPAQVLLVDVQTLGKHHDRI